MFHDRVDAGRRLGEALQGRVRRGALVLGLPRGGVPVAREVARALGAELDVVIVRKIGAPGNREFALGAISEGAEVVDWRLVDELGYARSRIEREIEEERAELARREWTFRGGRPFPVVRDREVVLVDDGIATGSTAKAAIRAVRAMGPRRIVLAVPLATVTGVESLRSEVDDLVALETPPGLHAVSQGYEEFPQTSDDEVQRILAEATPPGSAEEVEIPLADATLEGALVLPAHASGVVVFAHGSGSGRRSPRNRRVAEAFHEAGFGTLLVDLLSKEEAERDERDASLRFDIRLLARRLEGVVDWLAAQARLRGLPVALYGSSTGASAAIIAAAREPVVVQAVVSRGGRVDLAADHLEHVRQPTLLIVGSRDDAVLALNEAALPQLRGPRRLALVEGAGHLFEEPGALDEVARLAIVWLRQHLVPHAAAT